MAWLTGRGGGFAQFSSGPPDFGSGAMSARFSGRHSQSVHNAASRATSNSVQRAANFAQSRQTLSATSSVSTSATLPDNKVPSLRTSLDLQPGQLPSANVDSQAVPPEPLATSGQAYGPQPGLDLNALALLSGQHPQQLLYELTLQQLLSNHAHEQAVAAATAAALAAASAKAAQFDGNHNNMHQQQQQLEHAYQNGTAAVSQYALHQHAHSTHQGHQTNSAHTQLQLAPPPPPPPPSAATHSTQQQGQASPVLAAGSSNNRNHQQAHHWENFDDASSVASSSMHTVSHHGSRGLPAEISRLADPSAQVSLPPAKRAGRNLDNRELDKLVATLGRNKATWRRALTLYDWLKEAGHHMDDRLCTTLIRVCAEHGQAVTALGVYEWMRSPRDAGGAALTPTVYTYTASMRAALGANMLDKALQVWEDAQRARCKPDCRLCITYIEVCSRTGNVDAALAMYEEMRSAPPNSRLAPTVHAYTAAMRAATEGGRWQQALAIWEDMRSAGCQPTGHAFAAAISACAAGNEWARAVAMFDDMCSAGITPDVVSCTALVTALASAAQWVRAEQVVTWMLENQLRPNVRTYTALLTAMGNAKQWERAVEMLRLMQTSAWGSVQPNAYTYSALLKSLGEHGQWQLAEAVFSQLEREVLGLPQAAHQQQLADPAALQHAATEAARHGNWTSPAQLNGLNLNFRGLSGSGSGSQEQGQQAGWHMDPLASTVDSVAAQFSHLAVQEPMAEAQQGHDAAGSQGRPQNRWERGVVNEVVCGALMLAYERVGKWEEAVQVLGRARKMGIRPNTVMFNTAISAAGKAGQLELAERLFSELATPDTVTFETMIAAYGMAGLPHKAEGAFVAMLHAGWQPRDYAYCGLIAAHSTAGDFPAALAVQGRIRCEGQAVTIHVYNALLAACERIGNLDAAANLHQRMCCEGVEPNNVTLQLLAALTAKRPAPYVGHSIAAGMANAGNALAAAGNVLTGLLAAPQMPPLSFA